LIALGYKPQDAGKVINQLALKLEAQEETFDTSILVRLALKGMAV